MAAIEVKDSEMGDTDLEETRPMRLMDGRLVVWHRLDSCPPSRQAEPARSEPVRGEPSRSEPVRTEPSPPRATNGAPDDPDATRPMLILGASEGRRIAPR